MANVAARMVFFPQVVSSRKNVTQPRLDLFLSFPDVYDGAKVRLVVYHLDMYNRSPLCKKEGPAFFKFKQGDLTRAFLDDSKADPRHGTELNPKLGTETGVLLKMDGTLFRSKKKDVKAWWFGLRSSPEENTSKPFSILRLHMATTEEDVISGRVNPKAIGRIILLDDTFQNMYTDHRLAFRIALTSPHAGISEGGVIAASLCPEHNPACPPEPKDNPKNKGVVLFDAAAVKAGKPHPIGGDGGNTAPVPPTPNPRVLPFDLTGLYEHVDGARDPAILLHLNQAGHSLVGWFSLPIPVPGPQAPAPVAGLPPAPGCLWVSSMETEDKARGHQFFWAAQATNTINTMDPDAIVPQTNGAPGWIKRGTDPNDANVDAVVVTFEHNDGSASQALTLRKVRNDARWPWAIIRDPAHLTQEERDLLIADQVRPVATAVWERLRKQMDPKTVLEKGPPEKSIETVISDWVNTSAFNERRAARDRISNHLLHLMGPFIGPAGDYVHRAAVQIKAAAATYNVSVGAATDTVYGWLQRMVSQYMTELAAKRDADIDGMGGATDAQLYDMLENGFKRAEFGPEGKFIYTMTFSKVASTDKLPYIHGYWFTVTINKEVENKDKTRTQDATWGNKGWDKKALHGIFVATGIGAAFNNDGTKSTGKASKGGSLPGKTEFRSFASVTFPEFDGATFSVVGVSGPSVTGGAYGYKSDSSMVQFTLKNGTRLSAVIIEKGSTSSSKPSKSISGSFFQLSGGGGKLLSSIPSAQPPPDDTSDDIAKEKETRAGVFVLFARDSATLEQRNYFERRLAINRAMLQTGEPKARVLGYASPEASKAHNLDLSLRRATAVKMAVLDALDPDLIPSSFDVVGRGEEPAIKAGGLLDPPGKTSEEKKRVHEEELTKYWLWRAVDVWVQGSLVVRARPKEEQKGKP